MGFVALVVGKGLELGAVAVGQVLAHGRAGSCLELAADVAIVCGVVGGGAVDTHIIITSLNQRL